jgi:cytochrome c oxidase subunit 2
MFDFLDRFMPGFLEMLLPRASEYAIEIDVLFDVITILVGFWFFLVLGYFFYLIFRYRHRPGQKAEYVTGETHKQKQAIEIPHLLILACDIAIIVPTFVVWYNIKIDIPPPEEEVRIVSQQWAWTFYHAGQDGVLGTDDDVASVNELRLKKNVQYTYHLESKDVMHSFSIPVFRLKQDAVPGRVISGHFKPIMEGEWDVQCAEMCGVAHGIMGARVIIESEEEHNAWLAAKTPEQAGDNLVAAIEETLSVAKEDRNNG